MSKRHKKAQQQPQQQPQQTETAEPVSQAQSVFTKKLGEFGAGLGWFAGKVVEGFKSVTTTVAEKTSAAVERVKTATQAAVTKIGNAVTPATAAIGAALSAVALGAASVVTGVGKAIWNASAMDSLSGVWFVASLVTTVSAVLAAFTATLVLVAITAAPVTALVIELAPAAQVALAYATLCLVAWCSAAVIEVGQFQIARMCQRVHACIEQAARDLAANVRDAAVRSRRVLMTVDAVAVGA